MCGSRPGKAAATAGVLFLLLGIARTLAAPATCSGPLRLVRPASLLELECTNATSDRDGPFGGLLTAGFTCAAGATCQLQWSSSLAASAVVAVRVYSESNRTAVESALRSGAAVAAAPTQTLYGSYLALLGAAGISPPAGTPTGTRLIVCVEAGGRALDAGLVEVAPADSPARVLSSFSQLAGGLLELTSALPLADAAQPLAAFRARAARAALRSGASFLAHAGGNLSLSWTVAAGDVYPLRAVLLGAANFSAVARRALLEDLNGTALFRALLAAEPAAVLSAGATGDVLEWPVPLDFPGGDYYAVLLSASRGAAAAGLVSIQAPGPCAGSGCAQAALPASFAGQASVPTDLAAPPSASCPPARALAAEALLSAPAAGSLLLELRLEGRRAFRCFLARLEARGPARCLPPPPAGTAPSRGPASGRPSAGPPPTPSPSSCGTATVARARPRASRPAARPAPRRGGPAPDLLRRPPADLGAPRGPRPYAACEGVERRAALSFPPSVLLGLCNGTAAEAAACGRGRACTLRADSVALIAALTGPAYPPAPDAPLPAPSRTLPGGFETTFRVPAGLEAGTVLGVLLTAKGRPLDVGLLSVAEPAPLYPFCAGPLALAGPPSLAAALCDPRLPGEEPAPAPAVLVCEPGAACALSWAPAPAPSAPSPPPCTLPTPYPPPISPPASPPPPPPPPPPRAPRLRLRPRPLRHRLRNRTPLRPLRDPPAGGPDLRASTLPPLAPFASGRLRISLGAAPSPFLLTAARTPFAPRGGRPYLLPAGAPRRVALAADGVPRARVGLLAPTEFRSALAPLVGPAAFGPGPADPAALLPALSGRVLLANASAASPSLNYTVPVDLPAGYYLLYASSFASGAAGADLGTVYVDAAAACEGAGCSALVGGAVYSGAARTPAALHEDPAGPAARPAALPHAPRCPPGAVLVEVRVDGAEWPALACHAASYDGERLRCAAGPPPAPARRRPSPAPASPSASRGPPGDGQRRPGARADCPALEGPSVCEAAASGEGGPAPASAVLRATLRSAALAASTAFALTLQLRVQGSPANFTPEAQLRLLGPSRGPRGSRPLPGLQRDQARPLRPAPPAGRV
eukprot:tig00020938_g16147.t1